MKLAGNLGRRVEMWGWREKENCEDDSSKSQRFMAQRAHSQDSMDLGPILKFVNRLKAQTVIQPE